MRTHKHARTLLTPRLGMPYDYTVDGQRSRSRQDNTQGEADCERGCRGKVGLRATSRGTDTLTCNAANWVFSRRAAEHAPGGQSTYPYTHQVRYVQDVAVASQLSTVTLNLFTLPRCAHRVVVRTYVTMRMRREAWR